MASSTALYTKTILAIKLSNLDDVRLYLSAVATAAHRTTERLLIVLCCDLLNEENHYNHAQCWDEVQSLLACVYVEATRVAQEAERILLDVDVLLRGSDSDILVENVGWEHVFSIEGDEANYPLPSWFASLPHTKLSKDPDSSEGSNRSSKEKAGNKAEDTNVPTPSTYPVVAMGGTFDHLHSGHKILLSMAAWIAHEKVIVGMTDDILLQKKANREVLESLPVRSARVRAFMEFFKPGLVYDIVPIQDVYGPTAVDPYIQALVVSKETLSGASAIASIREEKNLPPLRCFVIDVVSSTSANLHEEDMDMLRKAKMSSTYIRQWIVSRQKQATAGS